MRWDCESVAKRGSRLVGLDSMRKVREEGSLGDEREHDARHSEAKKSKEVAK
jgi:hypothetical protein